MYKYIQNANSVVTHMRFGEVVRRRDDYYSVDTH